jgi:DNA-binding response OmpR family regulator
LLAEDDVETRRLLGAALRRQGFEVVEACDGAELLDHISAAANAHRLAAGGIAVRSGDAYDAVIADNQLPVLCGLDVLAALQCVRCPVPFILITAFADEDTRAEARDLGAAAFLEKPLSIQDLQAAVRTVIEPH